MTTAGVSKSPERVLTGVQPTGSLHLGNYFGAIKPCTAISKKRDTEVILMCVDLHALTNKAKMKEAGEQTLPLIATYLALGFELEGNAIILQSDFPEILTISWMLACSTHVGLLERAHAYKDAVANGKDPTCGLFYYPVLMASDILTFDAVDIPVGRDQAQHIEYAADMAGYFNNAVGNEVFVKPRAIIQETPLLVGTDGERKMSKSYGNDIPLFAPAKTIEKKIKGITTDAKGLDDPKDPHTCAVFQILSSFASEERVQDMRAQLERGTGYGYGHAKMDLIDAHKEVFGRHQEAYEHYLNSPDEVRRLLEPGRQRASAIAGNTLARAREALSLKTLK